MELKHKVSDFTKETSFHGVKYIFDGSARFLRRLVWILCVAAAIGCFLYQVSERSVVYFHYNTTISVNIRYIDEVPFPAVTLCNINTFRLTAAARLGLYKCINETFTVKDSWGEHGDNPTTSLKTPSNPHVHEFDGTTWNRFLRPPAECSLESGGETQTETKRTFAQMKHQLDDLVYACTWRGDACDMGRMFRPIWTDVGNCYTFNAGEQRLKSTETGTGHGLKLTLNVESEEYMAGPLSGLGVLVLLHAPEEEPQMKDLAYAVSPGTHTLLAVKHTQSIKLGHPYDPCKPEAINTATCLQECKKKAAEEKCGCSDTMDTFPDNITMATCGVLGTLCILKMRDQGVETMKSCGCDVPCTRFIYDATISYSLLDKIRMKDEISSHEKSRDLLPEYRDALDVSAQAVAKQVQNDDIFINELLDKSEKLREVTENIIESVKRTEKIEHLDIKTLFLSDMCASLAVTMNETMTTMYDKACRVETLVSRLPVLSDIDMLVAQLCGHYCLEDSCDYGFPSLILSEYKLCLTDEERQGKEGNISSNAYVQEKCEGFLVGETIPVYESEDNVRLSNCIVINACAQKLIDGLYSQYNGRSTGPEEVANSSKLERVVDSFKSRYHLLIEDIHNQSVFVTVVGEVHIQTNKSDLGIQDINRCFDHLDSYSHLGQTFRTLYSLLIENRTSDNVNVTSKAVEDYLLAVRSYRKVGDVLRDCYWFERYLWWREGPKPPCLGMTVSLYSRHPDEEPLQKLENIVNNINTKYCIENQITELTVTEGVILQRDLRTAWNDALCGREQTATVPTPPLPALPPETAAPDLRTIPIGPVYLPDDDPPPFNFTQITDPSDPTYEPIEKMTCFSAPIPASMAFTQTLQEAYRNFLHPVKKNLGYQNKQPAGVSNVLQTYRHHNVTFKKSQITDLFLNPRFTRVPDDMNYYTGRMQQAQHTTKLLFSVFGVYNSIYNLIDALTKFDVAGLREEDLLKLELLKFGKSVTTSNEGKERCPEDEYLCTIQKQEEKSDFADVDSYRYNYYSHSYYSFSYDYDGYESDFDSSFDDTNDTKPNYDYILMKPLKNLCFETGDLFYNITKRFSEAVQDYNQAYTALSEELKGFHEKWKELGDNYYRDNFLNLDIYYKELAVEEIIQEPAFEFLSLLSEVGGFLGLLLGASVLTVCEIIDFIFVTTGLYCSSRKTKTKSQKENKDTDIEL